ncbi:acyl-CoA dehydratase activase-related protein [Nannocystis pusilla]|uniref:Acyl-CoA dehydratase activase-related protein n=1 Tax=Nannocystis pusilla TaxID=889268 RepID=A0A9X3J1Q4_9BACT|nr:BadF/BadG/BcrA/BcrD ATPase family protein [Nannocystis pusilla]MCY1010288.1 acyl-CoA dehydratase activase-related protein [Nannocystis pusilla]
MSQLKYIVGVDLGSTTVKAVVVEAATDTIVWKDYQRHESKQADRALKMFKEIEEAVGDLRGNARMFITGSGGATVGRWVGAKFVQEVNAVSLAVEKLHPEVNSVIELGGQDAKIIIFKPDPETGRKKKIPSMNDKCAGGTGAVIDKINAKLKIPADLLCQQGYVGHKLHPVAGKCGVFAETDVNGLQKLGVPADELMASLFEAIVQQNLSVLTRGHTLMPHVLLLGGPNTYIKGMVEAWKANIPPIWHERNVPLPEGVDPADLIIVPQNAQYYAAMGAVEFGKDEDERVGVYQGTEKLHWYLTEGRLLEKKKAGAAGLSKDEADLDEFMTKYKPPKFVPKEFTPGEDVRVFIGIDGGSTSSKAVMLNEQGEVIRKVYQLSKGNPIVDTKELLADLRQQVEGAGCTLTVLGVGTTGYAKDILRDTLRADAAIVETVAHCESALHFYDNVDVVCDVGGQDIKIIILKNGKVKDFKLNTQCSAGNGYFLQSTAEGFGIDVKQYAQRAFGAQAMPTFGYGCAVFMQSDIVDFQRQGWAPEEIMAGLAAVLPKNIWLYVSQIPNLAKLGSKFILQGGTQHNLAAVKAQVDFIQERFKSKGTEAQVIVHQHCGESGAIGAALEVRRMVQQLEHKTEWIGIDKVASIDFSQRRDESTRCYFCKNKCLRTFIDVDLEMKQQEAEKRMALGQLLKIRKREDKPDEAVGTKRLIIATCEKGEVEDLDSMKKIKGGLDQLKKNYPNLAAKAAKDIWDAQNPPNVADSIDDVGLGLSEHLDLPPQLAEHQDKVDGLLRKLNRSPKVAELLGKAAGTLEKVAEKVGKAAPLAAVTRETLAAQQQRIALMKKRATLRIGIPRVLNQYSQNPFFSAYFEALGVPAKNIVYSDFTSEELYKEGAKRGAIDPCFPSKVCIAHMHNLVETKHKKRPLDVIVFPQVDSMETWLSGTVGSRVPDGGRLGRHDQGRLHQGGRRVRPEGHQAGRAVRADGRAQAVQEADVRVLQGRARAVRGGERPRGRGGVQGPGRLLRRPPRRRPQGAEVARAGAADRRGPAGPPVPQRPRHEPRDPGRAAEARLPDLHRAVAAARRGHRPAAVPAGHRRGLHQGPVRHHRRVEEQLQREHQPEGVGRQVHGASPEPGRARAVELQVRPRRADLHGHRGDHRELRHAVLLVQGHRREQADRVDQDPHRDHRLLPQALSGGHAPPAGQEAARAGAPRGVPGRAAAPHRVGPGAPGRRAGAEARRGAAGGRPAAAPDRRRGADRRAPRQEGLT